MTRLFRFSLLLSLLMAVSGIAQADSQYADMDPYRPHGHHGKTTFALNAGARTNKFNWNIASDITGEDTPNILSELSWKKVTLLEIQGRLRHIEPANFGPLRGGVLLEAQITGGLPVSGDNQDSDYTGNDRTGEFSRSNNDGSGGYAVGGAVSAGYKFNIMQRIRPDSYTFFTLAPLGGYGWDRQKYEISDGNQTIPALGGFGGLDSDYTSNWYGPFLGLEAEWEHNRHLINLRAEREFLNYKASATWNLRPDFQQDPSYKHDADGTGTKISLGYSCMINPSYDFTLNGDYTRRKATDGVDTSFLSTGDVVTTRLNEVNDQSYALRAGISHSW